MADTIDASLGYYGEFHFNDGSALYEAKHVKEFDIPGLGERALVDASHLKSGSRAQYLPGRYGDVDFEVVLNFRPLSDTDTKLAAFHASGETRAFKAVVPYDGAAYADIEGTAICVNYSRGRVTDGVMEATATFRLQSITTDLTAV